MHRRSLVVISDRCLRVGEHQHVGKLCTVSTEPGQVVAAPTSAHHKILACHGGTSMSCRRPRGVMVINPAWRSGGALPSCCTRRSRNAFWAPGCVQRWWISAGWGGARECEDTSDISAYLRASPPTRSRGSCSCGLDCPRSPCQLRIPSARTRGPRRRRPRAARRPWRGCR